MAEASGSAKEKRRNNNSKNAAEKEKNTLTLSKISNAIKGSEKLDVEGGDLLDLLSHLEGELQARDIAIAALKSEQMKRVLYGCYMGRARSDSPLSALQRDKTTVADAAQLEEGVRGATNATEAQIAALHNVVDKQRVAAKRMVEFLRESERQRSRLLLELEEERAKHERDTAQGDDITYELEKERIRLRQELEAAAVEKQRLEAAVKDVTGRLEEEKSRQKQIVLVLLSDRKKLHKLYLEEKKRSEDLAQLLQEEKAKMETMAVGLEEESKRSLAMEAELEKHLSQFGSERQQLRDKLVADERRTRDLEEALRKARADVEHFKKQLAEAHRVAMSQAAPPPPYPGTTPGGGGNVASVSPTPLSALNRLPPQPVAQQPPYVTSYSNYPTYGQLTSSSAAGQGTVGTVAPAVVSSGSGVVSQQAIYQGTGQATVTAQRANMVPTAGNLSRGNSALNPNPVVRSMSGGMPTSAVLVGTQQQQQQQQGSTLVQQGTQSIRYHSSNFSNSTSKDFFLFIYVY
jgi:Cortactin-binding protein-2